MCVRDLLLSLWTPLLLPFPLCKMPAAIEAEWRRSDRIWPVSRPQQHLPGIVRVLIEGHVVGRVVGGLHHQPLPGACAQKLDALHQVLDVEELFMGLEKENTTCLYKEL